MKTNKIFNFKRFYHFLSYDFRINGKRYLSFLAGGMVIFYLIPLIGLSSASSLHNEYILLFFLSLIGLGLFVGSAFPELNNKIKTGNYLLLPASTFEKTASQFLVYVVFGSIFFLLIFWVDTYLAKWTALQMEFVQRRGITIVDFHYQGLFEAAGISSFWDKLFMVMSIVSAGLFLFAARLFFKRFALVKSVTALIVAIFLLFCYMVLFSHIFYPETEGFDFKLSVYELAPELSNFLLWSCVLFSSLWAFFLPLVYYKLKEKQV